MKIELQKNADLKKVADLIAGINIALLTTVNEDNALVMRPMSPLQMDSNGGIWFFTSLHSVKIKQLHRANLSFSSEQDSTYVSLSGHGEIHNDRQKINDLWTPFARPWFPDGPESPDLALLLFAPDTAEFWDGPNNKMLRMFNIATSIVASKPIGLGEHDLFTHLSK